MEVYEHLLHIISDVGFSTTWPSKWGLSTSSDLYLAMQEAISAGVYDVSSYAGIDAEVKTYLKSSIDDMRKSITDVGKEAKENAAK